MYGIKYGQREGLVIVPLPLMAEGHLGLFHLLFELISLLQDVFNVKMETQSFPWPIILIMPPLGHTMTMLHVPLEILAVPEQPPPFGNILVCIFLVRFQ